MSRIWVWLLFVCISLLGACGGDDDTTDVTEPADVSEPSDFSDPSDAADASDVSDSTDPSASTVTTDPSEPTPASGYLSVSGLSLIHI